MKNIFRKTVKKVRETAAKVSRKTVNWLNSTTETENVQPMMYNAEVVLDAVQNTYNAYKAGYEAEPESKHINLVKYGFTRKDAWVLSELGLCDGADAQEGTVHMFYLTPEEKNHLEHVPFICKEQTDA
nr:MAG TPA: hypothetical protein [Caudoviricetes sp.]